MSETVINVLVGAVIPIVTVVVAQTTSVVVTNRKITAKRRQKLLDQKNCNLKDAYERLIQIINKYPTMSPNDVIKSARIEDPPEYSMEWFDVAIEKLDYKIDGYKERANAHENDFERQYDLDAKIRNVEWTKKRIAEIRDNYVAAKKTYNAFCESDKSAFYLYAGREVRNNLVNFEVVIYNVFISGKLAQDEKCPYGNIIENARQKLMMGMSRDLGL